MATQLTLEEREQIAQLLAAKPSLRKIGRVLKRCHTTINAASVFAMRASLLWSSSKSS